MEFPEQFPDWAGVGDTLTLAIEGFDIEARIVHDDSAAAPWDGEDGHGPVSDWTSRPKRPGEWVLGGNPGMIRRHCLYYDSQVAMTLARRDGWRASADDTDGTPGEIAARAVRADFEYLRNYVRQEWGYVGVVLSASRKGVTLDANAASVWSVECGLPKCGEWLTEIANDLLPEALDIARDTLATLCGAC